MFKTALETLSFITEAIAGLVIGVAIVQATWSVLKIMVSRKPSDRAKEDVRLHLARWLAVGLEFTLAADIIRTAIAPTWDEIGKLAAIATLRTVLNYFLEREIQSDLRQERKEVEGIHQAKPGN